MVLFTNPRVREISSTDSPPRKRRSVSLWLSFKRVRRDGRRGSAALEKCPGWVGSEIIFDFAKERLRKVFQLLLAHAGNSPKLGRGRTIVSWHFAEGNTGKDGVGWHIAFVGEFVAQTA